MQPRLNWVYGIGIRNWTLTEANKRSAGARKSSFAGACRVFSGLPALNR
jgi:hypothetical protein